MYNFLSSCWMIIECKLRIFCVWEPNDRTTHIWKALYFLRRIVCATTLSAQLIVYFWVYTQDFLYMKPQGSHSKSGYIFEKPRFLALNVKCYKSLSSFWIFECLLMVWFIRRTQTLHENGRDIFENVPSLNCLHRMLYTWLSFGLQKETNCQLNWHGCTVDNFDVCTKTNPS